MLNPTGMLSAFCLMTILSYKGDMFISNEGQDKAHTLLRFNKQRNKKCP
jgi:hypothetical protein